MIDREKSALFVSPIISYPRQAECGKTYLLSIDLRPLIANQDEWPLKDEESVIYCQLSTAPLFSNRALGEPAIVVHRYGGSYGPATFLLTAADEEKEGTIHITLVNGWGVPLGELKMSDIHITKQKVSDASNLVVVNEGQIANSVLSRSSLQPSDRGSQLQNKQVSDARIGSSFPRTPFAYRGILGIPPPTDSRTIMQREKMVQEIYKKLCMPDISALVLTGIGGGGKSTVAALVYRYAEEQRHEGKGLFTTEAVWLNIDPAVTFADLAGNLFEVLGKPLPDFTNLSLQHQAMALFNVLNTTDQQQLVVLDQFENLLDLHTGHALADRPGVAEWLDALNSQQSRCRILLTSRLWPQGTREYPPTYMQEFAVRGLEEIEAIDLLRKLGVKGTDAELRIAIERCAGHALSLTLLASLVRTRNLSMTELLKDPTYSQLWSGNIARNLLESIYTKQLDELQRKSLQAFSVYREPVPLEAAIAIINTSTQIPRVQLEAALNALLAQYLLQASGEGRFQLHVIVATYVQDHFVEGDEQANRQAVQEAHAHAAQFYLQQGEIRCPPREKRRNINDVQPLIEGIWQYCQADEREEAYDLMEREGIFNDLRQWGENSILMELYLLFLPLESWSPSRLQAGDIYNSLGQIYNTLGQKQQALNYLKEALSIYLELRDRRRESSVLNELGGIYSDIGRKQEALEHLQQALSTQRELGDRNAESVTLRRLGEIYNDIGQKQEALNCLEQALNIYQEAGDRDGADAVLKDLDRLGTSTYIQPNRTTKSDEGRSTDREQFSTEGGNKWVLPDPDVIFQFNVPLTDPSQFYGWATERATLISRTRMGGSTSIVGPRRMGKTWLLQYLHLIASQQLGSNFRIGYLDATSPRITTVSGFISMAIEELAESEGFPPKNLKISEWGPDILEGFVKDLRSRELMPVLCIDEFVGIANRSEFDISFFSALRAIEQVGLVLVVASNQPLIKLLDEKVLTSPFYNVFEQLILQPFDNAEAKRFVQDKGIQAGFTEQEQNYMLEYGRQTGQAWPPLRLQLVGKMILEDKNHAISEDSSFYRPNDIDYWRDFKKRLEEKYRAVAVTPE